MVLVFVPSFKAFLILYFVAMLCTSIRDWGNACTAEAQGRWVKVLQKSFLPAGFQMCRSPLSEGVPAPLSAGSWMETSPGDLSKGQRPGCPSPECGCHPRALIPMAQEELLRRGMSSHWSIWPESLGSPCQVILHLCPQPGWGSGSGQSTSGCPAGLSSSAPQNEN